jgi:hypothetical protein
MVDGRLQVEGQSDAAAAAEKLEWKRQEEMTDALGNVVRARVLSFALNGPWLALLCIGHLVCMLAWLPAPACSAAART